MKTEPTAGAMRAANVLADHYVRRAEHTARIIDAETGLPDLLAACEAALSVESQIGSHDTTIGRNERLCEMLRGAIAKAKGEK